MARIPGLIFDTHAVIARLVETGMPEPQARTVVGIQADLIENKLATKADIDTAITTAKFELIKWIVGVNVAAVVTVAGLFVTALGLTWQQPAP